MQISASLRRVIKGGVVGAPACSPSEEREGDQVCHCFTNLPWSKRSEERQQRRLKDCTPHKSQAREELFRRRSQTRWILLFLGQSIICSFLSGVFCSVLSSSMMCYLKRSLHFFESCNVKWIKVASNSTAGWFTVCTCLLFRAMLFHACGNPSLISHASVRVFILCITSRYRYRVGLWNNNHVFCVKGGKQRKARSNRSSSQPSQ